MPEVIVENGGDIFMKIVEEVNVAILAGNSLSGKIALHVEQGDRHGYLYHSGTVGHSYSRGRRTPLVLSPSAALADAAATLPGI